jgi:hypothetical protein
VANEGDCLVAGGVCQTPTYLSGKGKEACQVEFKKQLQAFLKKDVDFLIAEVCTLTIYLNIKSFLTRVSRTLWLFYKGFNIWYVCEKTMCVCMCDRSVEYIMLTGLNLEIVLILF